MRFKEEFIKELVKRLKEAGVNTESLTEERQEETETKIEENN